MGGKWKGLILFWLGEEERLRFGSCGLVHREVHEQVPPKVEY